MLAEPELFEFSDVIYLAWGDLRLVSGDLVSLSRQLLSLSSGSSVGRFCSLLRGFAHRLCLIGLFFARGCACCVTAGQMR